jgi:ABC-2 type transport system ATP-binding protein
VIRCANEKRLSWLEAVSDETANMGSEALIITDGLTKHYGRVVALDSLYLEINRGEVFGLLGPNGSGKTTTLRVLLGLLRPTAGVATVAGLDCWSQSLLVRRLVSYLPGELRMYGALSGLGMLKLLCDLREGTGLDRAVAIAERVMKLNLGRKIRTYSTGMKQKLALAQAFADPVETLILDEPTSALDPSARGLVLGLVQEARSVGQTVIFSGHVLAEVEQVADRVGIMRRGRLMHVESMQERRGLRMLLLRFPEGREPEFPQELALAVRERNNGTLLLEHRGEIGPLLHWLGLVPVQDIAIGTEDLRSLYDQFHGPNVPDEEAPV